MAGEQAQGGRGASVSVTVVRDLVHDLRSPLVAAQGFLSLMERAPSEPAAERYAASLRESIETMKGVLDRARAACEEAEHG